MPMPLVLYLIAKLSIVTLFSMFSVNWPHNNCLAIVPNLLVSFYLVKNVFVYCYFVLCMYLFLV